MRYSVHNSRDAVAPDLATAGSVAIDDYPGAVRAALRLGGAFAKYASAMNPRQAVHRSFVNIVTDRAPFQIVWDRVERRAVAVVLFGQLFQDNGDQHEYLGEDESA